MLMRNPVTYLANPAGPYVFIVLDHANNPFISIPVVAPSFGEAMALAIYKISRGGMVVERWGHKAEHGSSIVQYVYARPASGIEQAEPPAQVMPKESDLGPISWIEAAAVLMAPPALLPQPFMPGAPPFMMPKKRKSRKTTIKRNPYYW
jgi:hypothetical protein